MSYYNILSLDGGGTWAIIQAIALGKLYGAETPGREILKNFRLVVSNSGGSIVAMALWANMSPQQIVRLFREEKLRKKVFKKRGFHKRLLRLIKIGPKYITEKKKDGLKDILVEFGQDESLIDNEIHDIQRHFGRADGEATDLLIVAFDYDRSRAKFFRTNEHSGAGSISTPKNITLIDAVHASTNAPVNYFDAPAHIYYGDQLVRAWDGAIAGYNNPILAGITEALANGVKRRDIRVLSLGTGARFLPFEGAGTPDSDYDWVYEKPQKQRLRTDLVKLARCIVENPPDVATYVALLMISDETPVKGKHNIHFDNLPIVRLNPMIQPVLNESTKKFEIPGGVTDGNSIDYFRNLLDLDLDAIRVSEIESIEWIAERWLENEAYNQPLVYNSTTLECELGHRWFKTAHGAAQKNGLVPLHDLSL